MPHPRSRLGLGLGSTFADQASSSPAPLGPFCPGIRPPQTWGKVFQLQTGREERASPSPSVPSFSSRPPILRVRRTRAESLALSSPARPRARPAPFPSWSAGPPARYLQPQPCWASLPAAVAAPSPRPTRPAARRRAVPGQRPCQPRPPAPLPFPSPLQPMCGLSRPRAADPAMNPAGSRSLAGPETSRGDTRNPERQLPAAMGRPRQRMRQRQPAREDWAVPGPLSLPVTSSRTHLGGMSEAPGPAAGGSRGDVAALRCPPPAGPPVGLSCWSVLPAFWSRLSPAALSAHSYLERPEQACAAATMAPPRGCAALCAAGP